MYESYFLKLKNQAYILGLRILLFDKGTYIIIALENYYNTIRWDYSM